MYKRQLKKVNATSYSSITAKLGESPLDVPYQVVSFSMYTTKNGSPITYKSTNNRLTGLMKAAIKKIPKGGNLTFTMVKVKGPGGKVSQLDGGIVIKLI